MRCAWWAEVHEPLLILALVRFENTLHDATRDGVGTCCRAQSRAKKALCPLVPLGEPVFCTTVAYFSGAGSATFLATYPRICFMNSSLNPSPHHRCSPRIMNWRCDRRYWPPK